MVDCEDDEEGELELEGIEVFDDLKKSGRADWASLLVVVDEAVDLAD